MGINFKRYCLEMSNDQTNKVSKAVIAAAGFGTRFLPQTKAMPKEMLPIVDKPIIQYIVEELVDAGIEDIIIVTGYHKRGIEDHFDRINAELRSNLKKSGKLELLESTKHISELANFVYVRQKGPNGNATPLLNIEHLVNNEPFIYTWGDDFVLSKPSRFKQLIESYVRTGSTTITCIDAPNEADYSRYAYIDGDDLGNNSMSINKIIEKPGSVDIAPSSIASVGGYLFTPEIFPYLKNDLAVLPEGQEFIFQPSIQKMIDDGLEVIGQKIDGKFYDTGNKLEYLKTVVDFALMHDDLKNEFEAYLKGKVAE